MTSFFREPVPSLDASVVIPVRNEEVHIGRCLDSVQGQEVGGLTVEILVVDGASTDGTREQVLRRAKNDPRIHLLDNPALKVSPGLNAGLRASRGRTVIRMDAHALYEPDYIARSLEILEQTGASAVGGVQIPVAADGSRIARAIAAAQSSRFGTGGGHHRRHAYEGPAETLWLGAFRREMVEKIGGFDETLFRSEDNDFYQRLRSAGGRIWVSHRICARYVCRPTLGTWARQCFVTGTEIVPTVLHNARALSLRHFAPALALVAGGILVLLSALPGIPGKAARLALLITGSAYLIGLLAASTTANRRAGGSVFPQLLIAFPTAHLAYAVGTLVGAVRALVRPRATG